MKRYNSSKYYTSSYIPHNDYTHGTIENAFNHKKQMEDVANDVVS